MNKELDIVYACTVIEGENDSQGIMANMKAKHDSYLKTSGVLILNFLHYFIILR